MEVGVTIGYTQPDADSLVPQVIPVSMGTRQTHDVCGSGHPYIYQEEA